MKFKIFATRVSVEEATIDAASYDEASSKYYATIKKDKRADSTITRFVLKAPGHEAEEYSNTSTKSLASISVSPPAEMNVGSILEHYVEEMEKSRAVVAYLAFNCRTPEDLVIELESDLEEVLESRDYEEEFDAFMGIIEFARRALNQPDVIVEADDDL